MNEQEKELEMYCKTLKKRLNISIIFIVLMSWIIVFLTYQLLCLSFKLSILNSDIRTVSEINNDIISNDNDENTEVKTEESIDDIIIYEEEIENGVNNTKYVIDNLDCILQNPELPTGCEITSLAIVLNYIGLDVDKCDLADNYLNQIPIGSDYPTVGFYGNPRNKHAYGCCSPVIIDAANKYKEDTNSNYIVEDLTGTDFYDLLQYIDNNHPLIIWGTIDMVPSYTTTTWTMPDGGSYSWIAPFHCIVMYGYDKDTSEIYISDPLKGNTTYDLYTVEERYNELGKQAILVY